MGTSYSSNIKSSKRNSQFWICMLQMQGKSHSLKKAQGTHCTSHNNCGRLQHPTFTNGHIVETETKQGHSETTRNYEPNLIDIYRTFHPKAKEYTFFSAPHGTFSKTDHIMGHKTSLNRYKNIEIVPCILSDHHGLRLIFNNNINNGRPTFTWKPNNTLLNGYIGQGRNKERN